MESNNGNPKKLTQYGQGEEMEKTKCEITGTIPSWLSGQMIRNGPGEFSVGDERLKHWFDGHAIMHKFDISDGEVYYTSKFLKSETYKTNHKYNQLVVGGFGTPSIPEPCKNVFARFFSRFFSKAPTFDNFNINIAKLGDAYYASTDVASAFRIDQETLETNDFVEFGKPHSIFPHTSHPHFDVNGDYYNLGAALGLPGNYVITKIPVSNFEQTGEPLNDISVVAKIPIKDMFKPSYFHSFGMSLNYFVVHDQPVRLVGTSLMKAAFTWDGVISSIKHEPERESIFHVIDRETMKPLSTKFASKGRFSFHHINSYDEIVEGKRYLIVDVMCSDGVTFLYFWMQILEGAPENRKEIPKMLPLRFVLPLDVGMDLPKDKNLVTIPGCQATAMARDDGSIFLTPEVLLEEEARVELHSSSCELPQINYEDFNQRKYSYFYCIGEDEFAFPNQLLKVCVATKDAIQWQEKDCIPSEPVFIKRPGATEEDDGVILSTVLSDHPEDPIFLLILDGKTFKQVARAEIKAKLPFPFHGCFTARNQSI